MEFIAGRTRFVRSPRIPHRSGLRPDDKPTIVEGEPTSGSPRSPAVSRWDRGLGYRGIDRVTVSLHPGKQLQTPPVRFRYRPDRTGIIVPEPTLCGRMAERARRSRRWRWGWARRRSPLSRFSRSGLVESVRWFGRAGLSRHCRVSIPRQPQDWWSWTTARSRSATIEGLQRPAPISLGIVRSGREGRAAGARHRRQTGVPHAPQPPLHRPGNRRQWRAGQRTLRGAVAGPRRCVPDRVT